MKDYMNQCIKIINPLMNEYMYWCIMTINSIIRSSHIYKRFHMPIIYDIIGRAQINVLHRKGTYSSKYQPQNHYYQNIYSYMYIDTKGTSLPYTYDLQGTSSNPCTIPVRYPLLHISFCKQQVPIMYPTNQILQYLYISTNINKNIYCAPA